MKKLHLPLERPLIAPSLLSCDFARVGEEIRDLEQAGADILHVDVMDGRFVPNITVGPVVVDAMKKSANKPLDVHLMIEESDRYIEAFAKAGAAILTVHWEACPHLHRTIQLIHDCNVSAGVSINPATPVSLLKEILPDIDLVLLMSVNPGFGGQAFLPRSTQKIRALKDMIAESGKADILIEVDGGVSVHNSRILSEAGADILVCGSALFGSGDYKDYIKHLRERE